MATTPAGRMLSRQLQQMQSDKDIPGISCGLVDNNVFEWEVMLMISDDVKLYGGMYPLTEYSLWNCLRGAFEDRGNPTDIDRNDRNANFLENTNIPPWP